ncbi:MAG: hypothetical protein AAGU76_13015 [Sedimentibacter sp.]|uniref:hypothetical protein n=1 Tax=Sedimentibacter sp. TaxID=1960295 RepID=UPI0031584C0C
MNNMSKEIFLKKAYAFAFRLTGSENSACILAETAINRMVQASDLSNNMSEDFFMCIARDICNIYISNPKSFTDEDCVEHDKKADANLLQKIILSLEPLNRITIIWKDVYGFSLDEIIPAVNQPYNILQQVLASARRQIIAQSQREGNL